MQPGNIRQRRVRGDARGRVMKSGSHSVVGSRPMVTPSEGALFSLLSTQEATIGRSISGLSKTFPANHHVDNGGNVRGGPLACGRRFHVVDQLL